MPKYERVLRCVMRRTGCAAEETHAYHAIREKLRNKLRHPGRMLDLKTKDLISCDQTLLFISQS